MGSCHSTNSQKVVPFGVKDNNKHTRRNSVPIAQSKEAKHNNVTISYCWNDQVLCHLLADRLIDDGFQVKIDREKSRKNSHCSTIKFMDQSDCVIVCVSESYYNSRICRKEASYALDKHKTIISVQVEGQFEVKGWLKDIISDKPNFIFTGSKNNFILTYRKLVHEMVSHIV